jgi:hypothetical protein
MGAPEGWKQSSEIVVCKGLVKSLPDETMDTSLMQWSHPTVHAEPLRSIRAYNVGNTSTGMELSALPDGTPGMTHP